MPPFALVPFHHNGYLMAEKMVMFLSMFGTLAYLGWLLARNRKTRQDTHRAHLALRGRALEQAGSLEAFLAFAKTPEGEKFLALPEPAPTGGTALHLLQAGTICAALGLGMVALRAWGQGVFFGGTGVGLLLAGALTRRLQVRWEREDRES